MTVREWVFGGRNIPIRGGAGGTYLVFWPLHIRVRNSLRVLPKAAFVILILRPLISLHDWWSRGV